MIILWLVFVQRECYSPPGEGFSELSVLLEQSSKHGYKIKYTMFMEGSEGEEEEWRLTLVRAADSLSMSPWQIIRLNLEFAG